MSTATYTYSDYTVADPPHQPLYLAHMLKILKQRKRIRTVLDAGCGDGNFSKSIADADYQVYGIDLSEGGVNRAATRYPECTFRVASIYDDFREMFPGVGIFDAIISVEVIEHLYSPRTFVRRAEEALAPGGLCIVTTPYWGYLKNLALAVTNRTDRALTALWDGGHIKHWSYKTLLALFTERQFECVSFVGTGRRIPYLWGGMMMTFQKTG